MDDILQGLNEAQRSAVVNTKGPSLVIAGAGSGKTRVLTYRIAYVLSHNVPSYKILALTFTNKAAKEMKERIEALVGKDKARDLWMGTFHSVFAKILRYEAEYIGFDSNFTIYDTQDAKSLIGKIISDMHLDKENYKPGAILTRISHAKNNLILPQAYMQSADLGKQDSMQKMPKLGEIYANYCARCKNANAMDFDDLLLWTNILFRDNPAILQKYQQRFEFVLVDEFQDTNSSQHLIVKKLSMPENNICVVGDDAQSIYSFRGAKIENILQFEKDYPNFKMFKLEQNYRSTQNIVNAANSIISKNTKQIPKVTFSEEDEGNKIKLIETDTDNEEGFAVSRAIKHLIDAGVDHSDVAILYRTNAQSRIFEESLHKLQIPCRIYGGMSFFQRKEIKDIVGYIRVIINPKDEEGLFRVINYPARGIGQTSLEKIRLLAQRNNINVWDVLQKIELTTDIFNKSTISKLQAFRDMILSFSADLLEADAYALTSRIVEQTGITKDLRADSSVEGKTRYENLEEFLNAVKEFVETADEADQIYLPNFLEKVALISDMDGEDANKTNKVTLMTVHSAKGLEFKHCFIVGLEEQLFPSAMFGNLSPKELEEERRLFYVAVTRAKESVTLSYASSRRKWGNLTTSTASRFISEIDPQYLDQSYGMLQQRPTPTPSSLGSQKPLFSKFKEQSKPLQKPKLNNFVASRAEDIAVGQDVAHATFGFGTITDIQGAFPDSIATINFKVGGNRKLLLKFAKLMIVNE